MPTYEYQCEDGHDFEVYCTISARPEAPPCTEVVFVPHVSPTDLGLEPTEDEVPDPLHGRAYTQDNVPGTLCLCGATSRRVFRTAPMIWTSETHNTVLDYPGSKSKKAGYTMSHADKAATRVSCGAGGMINPRTSAEHPMAARVMPEWKTSTRRRLGIPAVKREG